ncbi:MAG: hypothetical protein OEV42_15615 [Deltaproteobacteria bacterium]|nr:hypothetical protein [Deltaproteobacteria bacterium]
MMKYFKKRVAAHEKGEQDFILLSDYDVLGEDLAIIAAICDQFTLYTHILTYHPNPKEHQRIDIAISTLWGLGQGIINMIEELQAKCEVLDEKFHLRIKEEYKKKLATEDTENTES